MAWVEYLIDSLKRIFLKSLYLILKTKQRMERKDMILDLMILLQKNEGSILKRIMKIGRIRHLNLYYKSMAV